MKKTALLLLLCACLLLSLAACAGERYSALYAVDDANGLTFSVRGSGTRPKQITVKKGDELLFSTKVDISKNVGRLGGDFGFDAVDLNFDGHTDFFIVDEVLGDCESCLVWLYDPATDDYLPSQELTGLYNVKADAELKAVFTFDHIYKEDKAYKDVPATYESTDAATKYVWKDGVLTPDIRVSITYYSEVDAYCYSVARYDEADKKFADSDDKWLTPEAYKTYDMGFLYYFK